MNSTASIQFGGIYSPATDGGHQGLAKLLAHEDGDCHVRLYPILPMEKPYSLSRRALVSRAVASFVLLLLGMALPLPAPAILPGLRPARCTTRAGVTPRSYLKADRCWLLEAAVL